MESKATSAREDGDIAELRKENSRLKRILTSVLCRVVEEEKVGRVFHDFNNILSSSMGYASLASERAKAFDDAKLSRYLENIERAGIRSRDLVRERLSERKAMRDANQCKLSTLFGRKGSSRAARNQQAYLDENQLFFLFSLFTGSDEWDAEQVELSLELVDETICNGCSTELRGQQWRLSCVPSGESPILSSDADMALAKLLVHSSGGHLCENLVQDKLIVVYLRSVTPEN